jgi:3-hydroxymyristoyl/3-hydroxydecanoyl-(acyl carrier protein) dehydratase/acyl carrier protein
MCYTKKIIKMGGRKEADPTITAQIQVPASAIWFDGHFPDEPILPGVAQLSMVVDLIGDALGHPVAAAQVSRVRFKQAIRPTETMTVQITPKEDPLAFGFQISSGEDQACSGNIKIAEKGDWCTMPNDVENIIVRIAEIMISELKLEDVAPETFDPNIDLVDEVGIDSMDLATVALVLRDEYRVRIDEDDYPKLTSIRLIAEYLHGKMAA